MKLFATSAAVVVLAVGANAQATASASSAIAVPTSIISSAIASASSAVASITSAITAPTGVAGPAGNGTGTGNSTSTTGRGNTTSPANATATGTGGGATNFYQSLTAMVKVEGPISGMFTFTYTPAGVQVSASNLSGLSNQTLGKYNYHIHTNRVPAYSGNNTVAASVARCGQALAHLDPFNVTENVACNPALPQFHQYCQTGDLSGKHGPINATADGTVAPFSYVDPYLRFFPQPFSLIGRSLVIHGFNKTRLGCGNIVSIVDGSANTGNSSYIMSYPSANPPAALATPVTLAVNGSVNSAGLASIGYTLAYPAPAANVTGIYLTTSGGANVAGTTTYAISGTALPTQSNIPVGFRKRVVAL